MRTSGNGRLGSLLPPGRKKSPGRNALWRVKAAAGPRPRGPAAPSGPLTERTTGLCRGAAPEPPCPPPPGSETRACPELLRGRWTWERRQSPGAGERGSVSSSAGQRQRRSGCQSRCGASKCRNSGWGREMPAAGWLFLSPLEQGQWFVPSGNPKI